MSYLNFVECQTEPGRKTPVFMVRNLKGEDLGAVYFRPQWRKFVLATPPSTCSNVFDASCLEEIVTFLKSETDKWRAAHV